MSFARFQEIVQRLTEADTWDQSALKQVATELRELEELVSQLKKPDLDGLLDGSILLVELVPKLDPIEAEDCQRMVVRLVQIALRRLRALRNARKKDLAKRKGGGKSAAGGSGGRPGMAIGDVLIQLGFISPDDLERALAVSKSRGRMVGEVLVEMGKCEREDVARAVFLQKSLQPAGPAPKDAAGGNGTAESGGKGDGLNDMLLGEALLRRGWINPEELLEALRIHKETGMKIGAALIQLGYANREQVQQALAWQTEMRAKRAAQAEAPDPYGALTEGPRIPGGPTPEEAEALREGIRAVDLGLDKPDIDAPKPPMPTADDPIEPIRLDDDDMLG